MRRAVTVVLGLLALAAPAWAGEARFALVAGDNLGLDDDEPLRWAQDDAARVRNLLVQLADVEPEHAELLLDPEPDELLASLARLRGQVAAARARGDAAVFVFFYSGHGDSGGLHMHGSTLPAGALKEALAGLGADVGVAFVDACRSGSLLRQKGAELAPAFEIHVERETRVRGQVMLTSSGSHENAHESDRLRGSLFTQVLLTGLRGAADRTQDGRVTLSELYAFAYHRTLAESSAAAPQHPQFDMVLSGEGDLVLTDLNRGEATLVLDRHTDGPVLLFDRASGELLAELPMRNGHDVRVSLPTGAYQVRTTDAGSAAAGDFRLAAAERRTLSSIALVELAQDEGQAKGAVELRPHRLQTLGLMSLRFDGTGPALGIAAGYRTHLGGGLVLGADVGYSDRTFLALPVHTQPVGGLLDGLPGTPASVHDHMVNALALVAHRSLLGPLELDLGGGLAAQLVMQDYVVAGGFIPRADTNVALLAGLHAGAELALPVAAGTELVGMMRATLLVRPESNVLAGRGLHLGTLALVESGLGLRVGF